jgi:hypothetical protein
MKEEKRLTVCEIIARLQALSPTQYVYMGDEDWVYRITQEPAVPQFERQGIPADVPCVVLMGYDFEKARRAAQAHEEAQVRNALTSIQASPIELFQAGDLTLESRQFPDGRRAVVHPLFLRGEARLCTIPTAGGLVLEQWRYPAMNEARAALRAWDGTTFEPPGHYGKVPSL